MEKEKLWVISELFYPEESSTGFIISKIAFGMSDVYDVKVLSGPAGYSKKETSTPKHEIHNGVEIFRTSNLNLNKNKLFTRFLRLAIISLKLGYKAIFKIKSRSKVLMVTNPVPLLILISFINRFKKFELSLLVHDVYPDNMVSAGMVKKGSWKFKLLNKLFNSCYAQTSQLFVLGRDMKSVFETKTKTPIHIIENWGNIEEITPQPKENNKYILQEKLEGKTVMLFAGNIGRVQAIDTLIEIIKKVKNQNKVHFVFAGGGAYTEKINEAISKFNLENITMIGPYKRSDQIHLLNCCDIGIVSLSKGMYGLGVPSKTYNLLAAGKPVFYIGDENSEIDLLVREFELGWSFEPHQIDSIAEKILQIKASEITEKGKRARRIAEDNFTYDFILGKFKDQLQYSKNKKPAAI